MPDQTMSDGDPAEQITISRAEYNELVADSRELARLHAAGVDNWQGY
jgi:hypothetical protein